MSRATTVKVYVSSHVRSYTAGQTEIEAEGRTLAELMADLDRRYPGLRFRVIDEQDRIRQHMNFFVGGELVRNLAHPIAPGDDVHILGALSGG
jgi:molybdopterin converting factor small subunit